MGSNHFPSTGRHDAARFGSEPLLTLPEGRSIDLASGYIPLLAQFTFEDKAAKGLRKRKAGQKPEPPIHFSALELVRDNQILLLTGPSGSGKTTFAKHLCFQLTTDGFNKPRSLIRNELGDVRRDTWDLGKVLPHYYVVSSAEYLQNLVEAILPTVLEAATTERSSQQQGATLIVLDQVEKVGHEARVLLTTLSTQIKRSENTRLLLLGETSTCRHWALSNIARHELLPLLVAQRNIAVLDLLGTDKAMGQIGIGAAAGNPALFALAIQAQDPGEKAEDLLDEWLSVASANRISADALAEQAYHQFSDGLCLQPQTNGLSSELCDNPLLRCGAVIHLLAARHLVSLHQDTIVKLFRQHPQAAQPVIRSCLSRLSSAGRVETLVEGLLSGPSSEAQYSALMVAEFAEASERFTDRIRDLVLDIVSHGTLTDSQREKAGRILSRLGDPRDLEALAVVPAGTFTMGSASNPNSQPVGTIAVSSFRIGIYPVVNKHYMAFIQDTNREWLSLDGADPERQNAPATDLTWHDARAYCAWLTTRWRSNGTIGPEDQVRLPTEPEWERAARGDQNDAGNDGLVYPWGTSWQDNAANSEETGFNNTCAVSIFPRGRSPYGCYDMAGHIWEWCTTLWGEDMATPSFPYPWRDDGREALDAPEQVRRVLRGGCFSSPKIKANCVYRGSLEPSGFWRGNGFRVVVARL
jgi:iron(II)-dependent oxidoreductase